MKKLVVVLSLFLSLTSLAQPTADIVEYINTYKDLAIQEMQRTGVPASIKLAQGIHETSAGKSDLVLKSKNHFGIKCKSIWTGDKVYHDDDARGECFRSYSNPADSYVDHSNFLRGSERYSSLFRLDPIDYKAWAYGLKKAGYATNSKYSQIIIKLIEDYDLQQYSLIALGKMVPSDEIMAGTIKKAAKPSEPIIVEIATMELPKAELYEAAKKIYPQGVFNINNTRVVFVSAGNSLLGIAQQYDVSLSRLLEFNDIKGIDVLDKGQLVYLQRKRKVSINEFHVVQRGESLYDIAQEEGIRLESLADYNHLLTYMNPAAGEKLYMQYKSPNRPVLADHVAAVKSVETSSPYKASPAEAITKHIVQTNETVYSISKKYGVEVEKILEWNRLQGFELKIGQELVIHKN
jgi:LysM repeat protein